MDHKPLLNLLRAHRKRSALSQDEVAFLLGAQSGAKICRYELLERVPELHTALALEAIFGVSISSLFPALFANVQTAVRGRAKKLKRRNLRANSGRATARKRESVEEIINRQNKFS